jgi:hypothetical protein
MASGIVLTTFGSLDGVHARVVERAALIADKSVPHGGDAEPKGRADVSVLLSLNDTR